MTLRPAWLLALLLLVSGLGVLAGVLTGSTGWADLRDDRMALILWEIRLPRSLGAWCTGALLGLAGAISQGLFRNPLADPYLLGSASGAGLAVALALAFTGVSAQNASLLQHVGLTGLAALGTLAGVSLTVLLARGVEQSLRLLLAGVVVGVVLNALTDLISLWNPDILRAMQAFLLGNTGLLGWSSVAVMASVGAVALLAGLAASPVLDALTLGEASARSLGMPLSALRGLLIAAFALATGAAVAQAGIVAFVGLVAPHLVRALCPQRHGWLLVLSALAGGALLLAADVIARLVIRPQELPAGLVTALLGGLYLLVLMHRRGLLQR
ncbi:iron chelate uptake ABC transporter family permease subunit [Pelomonas sp. UHG3]|uniref:Iron chelate uptake ABC transporter family permease subunit n=1 Tax=Roseateles hydrophilus TaxID=2975054 RepID=A0ACC6CF45_9BURK|nr:iron chelate uptake ABC transporter family permease subunit [Pelomonas sp. UHG3]MCY4747004.1 iron chelate uptake ABC transporter family permease subunit [Pelomonas sp. UHG3]